MDTLDRKFSEICRSHPHTEERTSHGAPCYFIRKGKQFAANVGEHHGQARAFWIAATKEAQTMLVSHDPNRYFVPPYVGVRGWVGVFVDDGLSWEELEGLVAEGYRLVAPAKFRTQLED